MAKTLHKMSLALGLAINLAVHADINSLPDLGDQSAAVISPFQERKLGEDFMRKARRHLDISDDPELKSYIQNLGQRLVAHSDTPDSDFRFFVINDSNINAFAVPGGFIGVNTGLILATRSEAELASVLAHEIAHITQRHIPRMLAEAKRNSAPAMAALLAAILLAASSHQGGEAAIALTAASFAQNQLNFTRAFEQEADRIGMTVLTRSGYDARAMPAFFEQMLAATRLYESNLPEFLRTHPITTRRIAESRDHAEKFPSRDSPDATDFQHAQARIRALTASSPREFLKQSKYALDEIPNADAARYAYALALLRVKDYDTARREVETLMKRRPHYTHYHLLRAQIEFEAGRRSEAVDTYAKLYKSAPSDRAVIERYAAALLSVRQSVRAREVLDQAVRRQPDDPTLYKMLATAAGDSGQPLMAHRSLAEYYYLNGDPDAALQQLSIAKRHAGNNHYYLASLEARAKEIKEEVALMKP